MSALYVFIGSGLGGVCRWLLGSWLNGTYPLGTFVANVLGCFILGFLTRMAPADPHTKLLLMTGFCGGFTTFSTFVNESFFMLRGSQLLIAMIYIIISLVAGLLACMAGYNIFK